MVGAGDRAGRSQIGETVSNDGLNGPTFSYEQLS